MFDSLAINLVVAASFLITALVHLFSPNRYWRNLIFFVMVVIGLYAFLAPLDITTDKIEDVLKRILIPENSSGKQVAVVSNNKGILLPANSLGKLVAVESNNKGTSIANLSFAIVAFVIAIAAGMVLTTVKEAEKRMKEQIGHLDGLVSKQMLLALSTKHGINFDQKLLATALDNKISLYSILVKFFRVDIDNETLIQSELEAIEQCHIKVSMLLGLDADNVRQYLDLLAQYHEQKNPEISRLCQKIRNS